MCLLYSHLVTDGCSRGRTSLSPSYDALVVTRPYQFEVFDLASGNKKIGVAHSYSDLQSSAIFIHNGTALLGGYDDGRVRVWSVEDQQERRSFTLRHSSMLVSCFTRSVDSLYDNFRSESCCTSSEYHVHFMQPVPWVLMLFLEPVPRLCG